MSAGARRTRKVPGFVAISIPAGPAVMRASTPPQGNAINQQSAQFRVGQSESKSKG